MDTGAGAGDGEGVAPGRVGEGEGEEGGSGEGFGAGIGTGAGAGDIAGLVCCGGDVCEADRIGIWLVPMSKAVTPFSWSTPFSAKRFRINSMSMCIEGCCTEDRTTKVTTVLPERTL